MGMLKYQPGRGRTVKQAEDDHRRTVLPGKPGPMRFRPDAFRRAGAMGLRRGGQVKRIKAALDRLFA